MTDVPTRPADADLHLGPPTDDETDALLDVIDTDLGPGSADRGTPGHDLARASARRVQAVRLRLQGASYDRIAQMAGYADKSTAAKAVKRALDRLEVESVRDLRALENMRLDADEVVLRSIIADTTLRAETRIRAIDSRRNLSARRSRLNGLDAPIQVALSAGVAADLEDALAEAEAVLVEGQVLASTDDTTEREEA